jgi:hypothetical protein
MSMPVTSQPWIKSTPSRLGGTGETPRHGIVVGDAAATLPGCAHHREAACFFEQSRYGIFVSDLLAR